MNPDTLLAVCDALVMSRLETLGKRILSAHRPRHTERRALGLDVHEVHTRWTLSGHATDKALTGAWDTADTVLAHHALDKATRDRVTASLDGYVRELLQFRLPHTPENLARRLGRDL